MAKDIVKPKTLSGFMELSPNDQILFNKIKDSIRRNFELSGFLPLDTPTIESAEVLLAKAGGETEKQVYQITKGDNNLCLIFDLTVPLAKYVASRENELAFPFRRYQIAKVYRGERAQKGRFREFYQCDIDIIGRDKLSIECDAEVPSTIYRIFKELNIGDFTIYINNRKLFSGLLEELNITDKKVEVLRTIDKLDKVGQENVVSMLLEIGVSNEKINKILSFISITGSNEEQLKKIEKLGIKNEIFLTGLDELKSVLKDMENFGVPKQNFQLKLSIARGLDYYTGTIYETFLNKNKEFGSISSGGRYDNLAENYTDKKLPGVGMSIGLTRLFDFIKEKGLIQSQQNSISKIMVLPMTDNKSACIDVVAQLRKAGIASEINFEDTKFKNKLNYANKLGIPYVIFIGDEELSSNALTIKNMITGEQDKLTVNQIIDKLS